MTLSLKYVKPENWESFLVLGDRKSVVGVLKNIAPTQALVCSDMSGSVFSTNHAKLPKSRLTEYLHSQPTLVPDNIGWPEPLRIGVQSFLPQSMQPLVLHHVLSTRSQTLLRLLRKSLSDKNLKLAVSCDPSDSCKLPVQWILIHPDVCTSSKEEWSVLFRKHDLSGVFKSVNTLMDVASKLQGDGLAIFMKSQDKGESVLSRSVYMLKAQYFSEQDFTSN